uniref:Putative ovule protein n=1 Tax=Solanum chacoense TaxID=4108 RepID=A0A0V0GMX0_SOLCH
MAFKRLVVRREGQPPRQKGQGCPTLAATPKSSRPPSRPVVWTTVRKGVREDSLDTWEARPRGLDTAPSPRGTSRAVGLTMARQSAREGALEFKGVLGPWQVGGATGKWTTSTTTDRGALHEPSKWPWCLGQCCQVKVN